MSFFASRRQSEEGDREEKQPQPRTSLAQQPIGFETVLGMGSLIEGKFSSKGNVRLDGEFNGTLDISGNILVGETAKIHADIDARNISIAGAVRGNVTGNKVQLLRTGRIWGDIHANALTIEEGAFIDGKITMKAHEANQPVSESVEPAEQALTQAAIPDEDSTLHQEPDIEEIESEETRPETDA